MIRGCKTRKIPGLKVPVPGLDTSVGSPPSKQTRAEQFRFVDIEINA